MPTIERFPFVPIIISLVAAASISLCSTSLRPLATAVNTRLLMMLSDYSRPQTVEIKSEQAYLSIVPPSDNLEIARIVSSDNMYSRLLNVDEELPVQEYTQIPYFWHIHKTGGTTMKEILRCFNRTQTDRECDSVSSRPPESENLKLCTIDDKRGLTVNIDTSYIAGIERAIRLRLFDHRLDNLVVATSRVYEALNMFYPPYRGRLFMLLRHPVERAISKYYYTQVATWERNYKLFLQNMTLAEYAQSPHCYNDWITRRLVNKMRGPLVQEDLVIAKELLRQKALVLLMEDMPGASQRVLKYFGWHATEDQLACAYHFASEPKVNQNPHPVPSIESEEWRLVANVNQLDIQLYEYARELYAQQRKLFT